MKKILTGAVFILLAGCGDAEKKSGTKKKKELVCSETPCKGSSTCAADELCNSGICQLVDRCGASVDCLADQACWKGACKAIEECTYTP